MISSRACSSTALEDGEIITAVSFPIPAKAGYAKIRHPASRFALTGVFVAKTKAGDVRVAATGASQNGVMRVPAIEAALKANWSAGALDSVDDLRRRADGRHPRLLGLSRQSDQGDGAARGDRGGLIEPSRSRTSAARGSADASIRVTWVPALRCTARALHRVRDTRPFLPLCIWSHSSQLALAMGAPRRDI